ncbi:hypothetical protein ACFX16_006180 [Malus domestica]
MAPAVSSSTASDSPILPPSEASNPNSSNSTSITIQNIGSMVPIKLTTTNYLTWSALFAPIFRRYNLTGLIDGSSPAPPQLLTDFSGNRSLNPAYVAWFENDQNILIWLNSTLSESLIPYTVGVSSARELWAKLESRLAAASHSHIHELRSRLRSLTKGDLTAAQYFQRTEEIADALASAGAPVEDSELISVILHGLPPEFDSFMDAIQFRLGSTTMDELHGLLLSKEIQLTNRKQSPPVSSFQAYNTSTGLLPLPVPSISHGYVAQQSFSPHNQNRGLDRNFTQGNHNSRGNFRQNNNPRFSTFNRGNNQRSNRGPRSNFSSNRKLSCQICRQFDHEACDCPHRMDPHYNRKSSQTALVANTSNSSSLWIVDSGATSHMTNNYATLQNPEVYTGPEQVYIGDGKGLPITHTGSSSITTSHSNFALKNVLFVPDLKHNLLSANQFLIDNQCSMHLYPSHFTMKDLSSGRMRFKSPVQHGFYPFYPSSHTGAKHTALTATPKASRTLWHGRLGHPSVRILNKLASQSCISVFQHKTSSFCSACALGKCSRLPFVSTTCTTTKPLEPIHTDVWGPSPIASQDGFRYYVIFVDDFTRYCWFYPLRYKSDVLSVFMKYKSLVENTLCTKIITLRSDFGGEYMSTLFSTFLA